jgi:hypothetical protein
VLTIAPVPEPASHPGTNPSPNANRRHHASFRLPSSQLPVEVIDLTDSPPSPPRSSRIFPIFTSYPTPHDVIDVDSLPDQPPPSPLPPRAQSTSHLPQRRADYLPSEDITRTPDVIMLGAEPVSEPGGGAINFLNLLRSQILGSPSLRTPEVTHYHYHIHEGRGINRLQSRQFLPPQSLNYTLNAHHVYGNDIPFRDYPGFKDEAYKPPPPARQGFTRSPTENMALICADCGDELGKNATVVKKEVWIGKCGHVYCGSCAARQKQNKARGVKAGKCMVEGCSKIISGDKGLMEVFF